MAPPLPQKGSLGAWLLGFRLPTLGIAVAPVLVGTAVAYFERGLRTGPALAALVGAILILIGTNLANDVFDFEKGADTKERLGPTRVTQAGLLRRIGREAAQRPGHQHHGHGREAGRQRPGQQRQRDQAQRQRHAA